MVSFAEISFSVAFTWSDAFALLISGRTFWAAKLFFGSSSTTKSLAAIVDCVVNRFAACTSPFFSAATVSGPPASSERYSLNVQL